MRRFCFSLLLLAAASFSLQTLPVQAQSVSSQPTAFVKSRLSLTKYTGENSPLLLAGPCGNLALDCARSSYGVGLEAGLRLSPAIGASIAYQTASYSSIAAADAAPYLSGSYRVRETAQLLMQYHFHTLSPRLTPYVQAGMHVTTGHTPLHDATPGSQGTIQIVERWAFGPSFTAGLDVSVTRHLAVFAEAATNVAFPDDAIDGHGGLIGIDRLSWAGFGLKIRNLPMPAQFFSSAASPSPPSANSTASVPSTLAVNEMGKFQIERDSDQQTTPLRYRWVFSDGTVREGHTVTKQFAKPGSYRVRVHYAADGATTDDPLHTFQVRVHPATPPVQIDSIALSPDALQPGQPITFDPVLRNGSPVEYRWDLGDGTVAFTRAPAHTYAEPGRYTVTLSVMSATGRVSHQRTIAVGSSRVSPDAQVFPYYVQLGAFSDADHAEQFARRHAPRLPQTPFIQRDAETGYYRVGIPYKDRPAARQALRALRRRAPFTDAFLQQTSASTYKMADQVDIR